MSEKKLQHGEHEHLEESHISSYKQLLLVLFSLLVLTAITIYSASFNFGKANVWIALVIASAKSSIVVLYFMHLRYEKPVFKYMFITAIMILAIFISFIFWDLAYRYK
ncbi:MAG: cytochrome C oxidase subunit IV family protein [Oligoflexia bacterium]|nr:cytochrome C oxidase subunit IV family protein [Oligoflexia bacterium]MBF0367036.1 cytochrome C oxidase subunit IV family protein [Oligoflexia bacterium]